MIILLLALLIFGAKRLPEIGKSLGESVRMFKKGISDDDNSITSDNNQNQKERLENAKQEERGKEGADQSENQNQNKKHD